MANELLPGAVRNTETSRAVVPRAPQLQAIISCSFVRWLALSLALQLISIGVSPNLPLERYFKNYYKEKKKPLQTTNKKSKTNMLVWSVALESHFREEKIQRLIIHWTGILVAQFSSKKKTFTINDIAVGEKEEHDLGSPPSQPIFLACDHFHLGTLVRLCSPFELSSRRLVVIQVFLSLRMWASQTHWDSCSFISLGLLARAVNKYAPAFFAPHENAISKAKFFPKKNLCNAWESDYEKRSSLLLMFTADRLVRAFTFLRVGALLAKCETSNRRTLKSLFHSAKEDSKKK